jgi:hypothetical protein
VDGPLYFYSPGKLVHLVSGRACCVWFVEIELDTSLCRRKRPYGAGGLLLSFICSVGGSSARQEDVPERIRDSRDGYEAALTAADRAWDNGHLDFSDMEDYLAALLQAQLEDEGLDYQGASSVRKRGPPIPGQISKPNDAEISGIPMLTARAVTASRWTKGPARLQ